MKAKGPKAGEVLIYEQIGAGFWSDGIGAKQFAKDLKDLGDLDDLDIRINSEGGSVFEGQAIYTQLKNHKAKKTVYIDGLAASIASVIAMAGDTIIMPENATMMIHDPWTMAMGNAEDMRKSADALDIIKLGIIAAYRNKSGMSDEEISRLMSDETWMSAQDALDKGFADEVGAGMKIAAKAFDFSKFKKVPGSIAALAKAKEDDPPMPMKKKEECKDKEMPDKECEDCSVSSENCDTKTRKNKTKKEVRNMSVCPKCAKPMVADECPSCEQEKRNKAELAQLKASEINRAKALRTIGKAFKYEALAEFAIEQDWSEDQLRTEILDRVKKKTPPGEPLNIMITPAHEGKPFRSLGEQLQAVSAAAKGDHASAQRLREVFNAASGANESIPSDGGFLVQSDFTTSLLEGSHETSLLYSRCRKIPVAGNGLTAPVVDETSRATGSRWGGVRVYRSAEAGTVTASKPKFSKIEMKLEKLMGIGYATDELLEDSSALGSIMSQAFIEEMGFKVDDEIMNGSGAGEMLGILNAGCLVSQAKETGQPAATVQAENIINMYSRMPARSKPRAVWLINSEIMPQLMTMVLPIGTAGVPAFLPPTGLASAPFGTLLGKPIIEIEQCAALGTVGDIVFADLNQYALIEKGGIVGTESIHVRFIYDEMTFKWTTRNNGQPVWKTYLTPYKGSATVSPFVALATRA